MIKIDPLTVVPSELLGIPYLHGGKTAQGADCIGLAIMWFEHHGVRFEYKDGFGTVMNHWYVHRPYRLVDAISKYGSVIRFQDLRMHDLLLIFTPNAQVQFPTGMAVMADDRHILSTDQTRGSFVEMLDLSWRERFWGAMRLKKADSLRKN